MKDNFKPADNYKDLLRQAKALHRTSVSMRAMVSYYQKKVRELDHTAVIQLRAELESEKEMNHQLTKELADETEWTCGLA